MKLFKKIAGFILAFAMILAIAMPSVVMADETYTLTLDNTVKGHTYEVYQIFTGKLSTKDNKRVLSDLAWGNGVKGGAYTESAKEKANTLTDETKAKAFAKELVDGNKLSGIKKTKESAAGFTVIDGLAAGYYLVKDTDDSLKEKHDSYTAYILQVVGDASVKVKSDIPTSEKKVKDINDSKYTTVSEWQDSADWDIGDVIPFKIEGTLPNNYTSYKKYTLKFHDKAEKGLTFNKDSVKVYVDNTEITDKSKYRVVTDNLTDGCTFEVIFDEMKNIQEATNNSIVRVEYTSTLNEDAVLGERGNKNTMHMEFSNNPNNEQGGEFGETPDDTVIVFTYKVDVNKVDENGNKLTGAEFTLEKKIKGTKDTWKKITKVSGTADDIFEFKGIDDGDYRLTETKAPTNYDKLSEPIYFTVKADHTIVSDDPKLESFSGNITSGNVGTMEFTANKASGALSTKVVNKPGSSLPETGGMGTTILYVAGAVMILAAGAFLVMQKKAEDK
ncbi:isopeptide-forming domain-containing fimbrial protein [Catenibacterium faecis]|uniref:isopeptide-forming domain-containing fimbrial protein n=1 Tax=Catenibacterium faecis TaxID=2764323 RepID=UPI003F820807